MKNKAQSTVEYAILIIIILGVFIAMQQYIKRGFQGRWKTTMDDFGEQYDPRLVNSEITYTLLSNSDTVVKAVQGQGNTGLDGFFTDRTDQSHSVETKQGFVAVGAFDSSGNPIVPEAIRRE